MLLGGIWCPIDKVKIISKEIRQIKAEHNAKGELKWIKVSNCRLKFYQHLLDYFFSKDGLNFRCLVVIGKGGLNHSYFNQGSHDSFYYKMYYQLLLNIVSKPESKFNIYLDIKDTRGSRKVRELHRILHVKLGDQNASTIKKIQLVCSHESQLLQLADFLIGAVSKDFMEKRAKHLGRDVTFNGVIEEFSQSKVEGFWHVITRDDATKTNRLIDYRRGERLPWAKPLVENPHCEEIKFFFYDEGSTRKGIRHYIWLERGHYAVVLKKRKYDYYWVTAFYVEDYYEKYLQKKFEN